VNRGHQAEIHQMGNISGFASGNVPLMVAKRDVNYIKQNEKNV